MTSIDHGGLAPSPNCRDPTLLTPPCVSTGWCGTARKELWLGFSGDTIRFARLGLDGHRAYAEVDSLAPTLTGQLGIAIVPGGDLFLAERLALTTDVRIRRLRR